MTQTDTRPAVLPALIEDEADTLSVPFDLAPTFNRLSDQAAAAYALHDYSRTDTADRLAEDTADDDTPNGAAVRAYYADKPDWQPRTHEPNGTNVSWKHEDLLTFLRASRPALHPFLDAVAARDAGEDHPDVDALLSTLSDEAPADSREPLTEYLLTVTHPGKEDAGALRALLEQAGYTVGPVTADTRYAEAALRTHHVRVRLGTDQYATWLIDATADTFDRHLASERAAYELLHPEHHPDDFEVRSVLVGGTRVR